jgi:hypothetical protein
MRRLECLAVVGVLAVAASTVVAGPAGAATLFTHSAKSGELRGGRLTLRGVSRRVTAVTNAGHSGVVSVTRLHARLFGPGTPPATGTLHVAGNRGGDESTFSLSRPRYSASRHTVSYAAKPLNHRSLPSRGARAAQSGAAQQFGTASLSIVPPPELTLGDNGGLDCSTTLTNNTSHLLEAAAEPNWPTDTWNPGIPFQAQLTQLGTGTITFVSDGGFLRGCSGGSVWVFVPDASTGDPNPPSVSFTTTTTYPWSGQWTDTCVSSDPQDFPCQATGINGAGNASWSAYEPPHQ